MKCRVCDNPLVPSATGECSACGGYQCHTCGKWHIGAATDACSGEGVPMPDPPGTLVGRMTAAQLRGASGPGGKLLARKERRKLAKWIRKGKVKTT